MCNNDSEHFTKPCIIQLYKQTYAIPWGNVAFESVNINKFSLENIKQQKYITLKYHIKIENVYNLVESSDNGCLALLYH